MNTTTAEEMLGPDRRSQCPECKADNWKSQFTPRKDFYASKYVVVTPQNVRM